MTHRGPFQPLPFCDSVKRNGPLRASRGEDGVEEKLVLLGSAVHCGVGVRAGWLACRLKVDVEVCM